jgi:hypothetical protein
MKAIAKEPITYGKNGETAQPGEEFDCPDGSVDQLLELGHIELPTRKKNGSLPDDFPGRAALEAAGLDTYGEVRAAGDVTAIPGIGAATAKKIADALED